MTTLKTFYKKYLINGCYVHLKVFFLIELKAYLAKSA